MRRIGVAVVTAAAALSVGLAGCTSPTTETPIVVSHVHAVDYDLQRESAYVATHDGVISVAADGSVERIGQWAGDVMGMARFGDTIYFSGHPAPDENLPPNIGVYELSVQSGEFAPISLIGEVDFHSMTIAQSPDGMALAGIDSATGQVMVSRDGAETWTTGVPIGARSLSWDSNAERLYATTERGLLISTDDGKGEGLQAVAGFRAGEIVFTFTGSVVNEQTLYTLQIEPGKYLSDPLVMGKVLHSCAPNMHCDMRTLTFTAVRDIAPGEMLTMDYESTEDELFRQFFCGCGAASCRGWIRGSKVSR